MIQGKSNIFLWLYVHEYGEKSHSYFYGRIYHICISIYFFETIVCLW